MALTWDKRFLVALLRGPGTFEEVCDRAEIPMGNRAGIFTRLYRNKLIDYTTRGYRIKLTEKGKYKANDYWRRYHRVLVREVE